MDVDNSLISRVPLFASLPEAEIDILARHLEQRHYPAQTLIFREGDHGNRFYIVQEGAIAIIKAMGTVDERLLGVRGPGEFIGEMSLINPDGLRTASARIESPNTVLLELKRKDFDALLLRKPTLAYDMMRVISGRLTDSNTATIRDLSERNERLEEAYAELQAAQEQIIEKESLERELRHASKIQASLLPRTLPKLVHFDIGASILPARMVGGDLYDVMPFGSDILGLVVGDVSGKGVPAALFMALTVSLLRAKATAEASPEEVLQGVNQHLIEMNDRSMFVTVLYGLLHRRTREFVYVRAGHELPLIWDESGRLLHLEPGRGQPLGLFPAPVLETTKVTLAQGSTLLLYTDGATEAKDPQGHLIGDEGLQTTVTTPTRLGLSAQELCDDMVQFLTDYHGEAPQADDITLLAVRAL